MVFKQNADISQDELVLPSRRRVLDDREWIIKYDEIQLSKTNLEMLIRFSENPRPTLHLAKAAMDYDYKSNQEMGITARALGQHFA